MNKTVQRILQVLLTPLMLVLIGIMAIVGLFVRLYQWVWEDMA